MAALSDELGLVERQHEERLAEAARLAVDEMRHATEQTDAALAEQASLQTAVIEAHALCEAFDGQLRASATQLTEREVFVCVLLAELSAVDLQHAAGATAAALSQATQSAAQRRGSAPPPSRLPPPSSSSRLVPPPPRAGRHLGLAARSRRDDARGQPLPGYEDPHGRAESDDEDEPADSADPAEAGRPAGALPTPSAAAAAPPSTPAGPSAGAAYAAPVDTSVAWAQVRLEQELQAALDAAAASQRAAAAAEHMAAQQQASFALTLRREQEKMRSEHQREVAAMWSSITALDAHD